MSLSRELVPMLAGVLLFAASSADAAMCIQVRLARIDGTLLADVPANVKAALGNPTATGSGYPSTLYDLMAHTYQFDIYASVYGADNQSNNEGVQSLIGNIAVDRGVVTVAPAGAKPKDGSLAKVVGLSPFNDNGTQNGKLQFWGMGSAPATVADDYVVLRAASMQTYDITQDDMGNDIIPTQWRGNGSANAGIETRVGSFTLQYVMWGGVPTIGWNFAMAPDGSRWNQGALWLEDGQSRDAATGQLYSLGYSFFPEPAALPMLALAALPLLARRRR